MIVNLLLAAPIITEVMANVAGLESGPGDRNEFVEVLNLEDTANMSGWIFSDLDVDDTICAWEDSTILEKYPQVIINSTTLLPNRYALILDREYTKPDTDQYLQPYEIPDSTLILTTDDTSLGNGLSTADPLLLFAPDSSCTTSFGTPFDTLDTIPFDPGDGISIEIIDVSCGDQLSNWYPSLDPSGSTPGKDNSTFNNYDLAVNDLVLHPPVASEKSQVKLECKVYNCGLQPIDGWELIVFNDRDRNFLLEEDEQIKEITGNLILPGNSTTTEINLGKFSLGDYQLGCQTFFTGDVDGENDTSFITLSVVPKVGMFSVTPELYYPDREKLQIEYQLPNAGGDLQVSIYSDRGSKIEDVINQRVHHTRGTIFWDGERTKIGYYIVLFDYQLSGKTYREKKTFVVAR